MYCSESWQEDYECSCCNDEDIDNLREEATTCNWQWLGSKNSLSVANAVNYQIQANSRIRKATFPPRLFWTLKDRWLGSFLPFFIWIVRKTDCSLGNWDFWKANIARERDILRFQMFEWRGWKIWLTCWQSFVVRHCLAVSICIALLSSLRIRRTHTLSVYLLKAGAHDKWGLSLLNTGR